MGRSKDKPVHSQRLLDYLPAHPRFDGLRRIFIANEFKRAKQLELLSPQDRAA